MGRVVVVGSGIGGLIAAAALRSAGRDVLVLEAEQPGGSWLRDGWLPPVGEGDVAARKALRSLGAGWTDAPAAMRLGDSMVVPGSARASRLPPPLDLLATLPSVPGLRGRKGIATARALVADEPLPPPLGDWVAARLAMRWPLGGGSVWELLDGTDAVAERPVPRDVRVGHRVEALRVREGKATGVVVATPDGTREIDGDAFVLAMGPAGYAQLSKRAPFLLGDVTPAEPTRLWRARGRGDAPMLGADGQLGCGWQRRGEVEIVGPSEAAVTTLARRLRVPATVDTVPVWAPRPLPTYAANVVVAAPWAPAEGPAFEGIARAAEAAACFLLGTEPPVYAPRPSPRREALQAWRRRLPI